MKLGKYHIPKNELISNYFYVGGWVSQIAQTKIWTELEATLTKENKTEDLAEIIGRATVVALNNNGVFETYLNQIRQNKNVDNFKIGKFGIESRLDFKVRNINFLTHDGLNAYCYNAAKEAYGLMCSNDFKRFTSYECKRKRTCISLFNSIAYGKERSSKFLVFSRYSFR
jgi:hypothetical protein